MPLISPFPKLFARKGALALALGCALLAPGNATAGSNFTIGFSDMPAEVDLAVRLYNANTTKTYLDLTYTITGSGVGSYVKSYNAILLWDRAASGTGPAPFSIPANDPVFPHKEPTSVRYDASQNRFYFSFWDSYFGEYWKLDPFLAEVRQDYFARLAALSNSTLGSDQLIAWSRKSQAADALKANAKYDGSRISLDFPFGGLIPALPFDGSRDDVSIGQPRAFATVSYGPNSKYFAKVFCFPGKGNTDYLNKPVFVVDAFDPLNKRDAWGIYSNRRYQNLLSTDAGSPRGQDMEYDMFFMDFSQGGGDILINASLALKFLEWLQENARTKVIVGGPSMGGIVVRTALLYSMPSNNIANGAGVPGKDLGRKIKGYLSIDSPHLGASISPDVQEAVYDLSNHPDVNWAADFFGQANSAKENWGQLASPAAHQMLYGHYYEAWTEVWNAPMAIVGIGGVTEHAEERIPDSHDGFYGFLASMGGFRKDMASASIAYSNLFQPHKTMLRSKAHRTGYISAEGIAIRNFGVGLNAMDAHELAPGSVGDWYFKLRTNQNNKNVYPYRSSVYSQTWFNTFENFEGMEVFKGTFIPFYSALNLEGFDVYNPPTQSEASLAAYSKFDFTYFMQNESNDYYGFLGRTDGRTGPSIDMMRYEHIIFDGQLMGKIKDALQAIETLSRRKSGIAPALTLLLD